MQLVWRLKKLATNAPETGATTRALTVVVVVARFRRELAEGAAALT